MRGAAYSYYTKFMNDVSIEKLTKADWGAYKELRLRALREEPQAFDASFTSYANKGDEYWKDIAVELTDARHLCLVAKRSGVIVAVGIVEFDDNEKTRHVADLTFLYVLPDARGAGIGKGLLEHMLAAVQSRPDILKVNVRVCSVQHAAVHLYTDVGFKQVSEMKQERYVEGVYYDDYKMSVFLSR